MYISKFTNHNNNGDNVNENLEVISHIYKDCDASISSLTTMLKDLKNKDNKIKETTQNILKGYERYLKESKNLLKKGKEPILPTITINGNEKKGSNNKILEQSDPDTKVKLDTIGIFKGDKLLGYTTEDESRGINIILNEVDEMITEYKCGKGNVVINLTNMKTKVKVKLKNNKPTVKLKINSKGAIQEINCNKNLEKNTTIKEIEKLMNIDTK